MDAAAVQQYIREQVQGYFEQQMAERDQNIVETQRRVKAVEDRCHQLFSNAEGLLDEGKRESQQMSARMKEHSQQLQQAELIVTQISGQGDAHGARMKEMADAVTQHQSQVAESQKMLERVMAEQQATLQGHLQAETMNLNQRMKSSEDTMNGIYDNIHKFANETKAELSRSSGGGGSNNNSKIRDVIDPAKDLAIERIKEGATKEEFGAWRTAADVRIECIPGCSG